MRLIDADLFMQRIEPYNTLDEKDKALYNFALNEIVCMPTVDVLDKIRAEIELLSNANPSYWHSGDMVEREEVLDIIDKYMKGDST